MSYHEQEPELNLNETEFERNSLLAIFAVPNWNVKKKDAPVQRIRTISFKRNERINKLFTVDVFRYVLYFFLLRT